ncbi:sugar ABC transporter substrate-binding protein [Leifsonia sp. LS1]|uniref:ABC transporter substrate-binding protein n=1 Tax=unclassified Leifsonia TaxID=2663824 RepID=UPI001CC04BB4|nr:MULTISPECIES: sugar ABC transporter substrate-binding protein [unclassified Leifsonia]UAJ78218.1 sugar ABC transporter substrate-binding protein [Leifsonia sp. ZF2019]GIT80652.1 sugar ABC transporter substrate-binding protein [Leifsonia sp. LS1]
MRKRAIAVAAAVATAALALAGCSGSGSGSSSSGSTITYWASNQGTSLDNDKEVLTPVLDEFTKQTGVKVKLEVIGWNDLQTRIQTAVTSGQGPDVLNIGNTWAASLQATGAFLPFGDSEMKAIGGSDKFVKTALETGGAAGKTPTSVPLYGLAYGLYYNKQMFTDAGVQPPTTWEELVTDAKKLTNGTTYGFSLAAGSYTENAHFAFINSAQNGGAWFDSKGDPTFTTSANVDGIKRYLDLMQTDKVVNTSNAQYDNGVQAVNDFATGKVAMILSQNNADSSIVANGMKSDQYGVVPFPAPDGGKPVASHVAGINLSIFKNTKNKDAALKFVKYMTSEDTQTTLGKPYASLPVLNGAKAVFTDNADEAATFTKIYNEMSKPLPLVPAEDQFENTVGKAMNDMFAKIATGSTVSDSDIKAALQSAQDQVKQSLGG